MLKDLQIHMCVQTFRKISDLKHMHACNCLITSPEQFIVISLRTDTQLRFSLHFTLADPGAPGAPPLTAADL